LKSQASMKPPPIFQLRVYAGITALEERSLRCRWIPDITGAYRFGHKAFKIRLLPDNGALAVDAGGPRCRTESLNSLKSSWAKP
jgi:hypothetical protein